MRMKGDFHRYLAQIKDDGKNRRKTNPDAGLINPNFQKRRRQSKRTKKHSIWPRTTFDRLTLFVSVSRWISPSCSKKYSNRRMRRANCANRWTGMNIQIPFLLPIFQAIDDSGADLLADGSGDSYLETIAIMEKLQENLTIWSNTQKGWSNKQRRYWNRAEVTDQTIYVITIFSSPHFIVFSILINLRFICAQNTFNMLMINHCLFLSYF